MCQNCCPTNTVAVLLCLELSRRRCMRLGLGHISGMSLPEVEPPQGRIEPVGLTVFQSLKIQEWCGRYRELIIMYVENWCYGNHYRINPPLLLTGQTIQTDGGSTHVSLHQWWSHLPIGHLASLELSSADRHGRYSQFPCSGDSSRLHVCRLPAATTVNATYCLRRDPVFQSDCTECVIICPAPCNLTFDLLTLKVASESRVTGATSVTILVFLGLSVLDLGPMYATDVRQTPYICQTASSLNASA